MDYQSMFVEPNEECQVAMERSPILNFIVEGWLTNNYIILTDKRMYVKSKAKLTLVANRQSNVFETTLGLSQVINVTLEHYPSKSIGTKKDFMAAGILILISLILGRFLGGLIVFLWFVFAVYMGFKVLKFLLNKTYVHLRVLGASSASYYVNAFGYSKECIDQLRRIVALTR